MVYFPTKDKFWTVSCGVVEQVEKGGYLIIRMKDRRLVRELKNFCFSTEFDCSGKVMELNVQDAQRRIKKNTKTVHLGFV